MSFFNRTKEREEYEKQEKREERREERQEENKEIRIALENNKLLKQILDILTKPKGVQIVITGENIMAAELVLAQGETKPAELHYVDGSSNDLGLVPSGDSPSFSTGGDPHLTVTTNPDGTVSLTNANTGNGDVDVVLTASAKGFSDTKVVTCTGIGGGTGSPAGVKIVFPATPSPSPVPNPPASVTK